MQWTEAANAAGSFAAGSFVSPKFPACPPSFVSFALISFAAAQENPLIVEADESLQWLRAENQYVATGNASAEQGDMRLTSNVIIAHYETENNKDGDYDVSAVTFVEGKGNSKLTRATLTATAHTITYDIIDEFVELKGGNPKSTFSVVSQ